MDAKQLGQQVGQNIKEALVVENAGMPKAASLGSVVGLACKEAGLLWKDEKTPVPLIMEPRVEVGRSGLTKADLPLDVSRTQKPRLLTSMFSNPKSQYAKVLSELHSGDDVASMVDPYKRREYLAKRLLEKYPQHYAQAPQSDDAKDWPEEFETASAPVTMINPDEDIDAEAEERLTNFAADNKFSPEFQKLLKHLIAVSNKHSKIDNSRSLDIPRPKL